MLRLRSRSLRTEVLFFSVLIPFFLMSCLFWLTVLSLDQGWYLGCLEALPSLCCLLRSRPSLRTSSCLTSSTGRSSLTPMGMGFSFLEYLEWQRSAVHWPAVSRLCFTVIKSCLSKLLEPGALVYTFPCPFIVISTGISP